MANIAIIEFFLVAVMRKSNGSAFSAGKLDFCGTLIFSGSGTSCNGSCDKSDYSQTQKQKGFYFHGQFETDSLARRYAFAFTLQLALREIDAFVAPAAGVGPVKFI